MNRSRRKINYLKAGLVVFAAAFSFAIIFFGIRKWETSVDIFTGDGDISGTDVPEYENLAMKEDIETFLVMGLDKFSAPVAESYNNDKCADFIMLLVFDNLEKTCDAIHINRDTMTDVNILGVAGNSVDKQNMQIALAHTYGNGKEVSCRNTADAVSQLLKGVNVDHYMSVTMDAVPLFNDMVGGVTVEVLDDMTSADPELVKGKTVTLKGEQALAYVRTRFGLEDSTNNTRMIRQQQYITALYGQITRLMEKDETFINNLAANMANYLVSDRSVNRLQEIGEKFSSYTFNGITSIEGEYVKGDKFMEFYPDDENIEKTVKQIFFVEMH